MINPNSAFDQIKELALKAFHTKMQWHSLVKESAYEVQEINANDIRIKRLDTGTIEILTSARVKKAVVDFNNSNGKVKRRHLISPTVAEETAFVLFHPNLTWDETGDYIIEIQ